jgi:arginyl-tRNA synthetase
MAENLFDFLETIPDHEGAHAPWAARAPRRAEARYDVKLVPRAHAWQQDPASLAALERIEAQPWVSSVTRDDSGVELRLDDGWIESTGAALEAGGTAEATLADLAHGQRYSVQFWDANATKALHVGHLRNLSTGNAIAAALAQAGGQVERRSLISDTGRSMGEAMAGVKNSGRHAHSWPDGGQKSDHFVGDCYANYVADALATTGGAADGDGQTQYPEDSQTRELTVQHDIADDLLKRVLAGDRDTIELWYKTRAWVIAGQRKTLARLDVAFDRVFFESDFLEDGVELIAAGLRDGRLRRREDGVVVYPTGIDGFEELPLLRPDGMSTQHMRALVYWSAAPDLQGVISMQIAGSEWASGTVCRRQLQVEMQPPAGVHPTHDIYNAMVSNQKRAITSSEGALLIDDLIDWVDGQIDGDATWREICRGHPAPERMAPQVALGYFLPYPVAKPLEFDPQKLLRESDSLGWDLVRARAQRSTTAGPGQPANDPEYRFAVVQSELYRQHLRVAVERLDVSRLALYLKHLAHWHLERDRGEHVERVVHTLLDRSARGLGLEAA